MCSFFIYKYYTLVKKRSDNYNSAATTIKLKLWDLLLMDTKGRIKVVERLLMFGKSVHERTTNDYTVLRLVI